ncbi:hypothetical protein A6X21_12435 [Planctopirus hydrillae]|uniref:Uncharacterized protein n=2 Tax=Planctopirus hydrillae TaxID=1841610 RepID=A0A1C3E5H8_9PLAN|nr:hypothetical protein A6X21_12435 [Planctopirus hydrillae]
MLALSRKHGTGDSAFLWIGQCGRNRNFNRGHTLGTVFSFTSFPLTANNSSVLLYAGSEMSLSEPASLKRLAISVLILLSAIAGGVVVGVNGFAMAWTASERHSWAAQVMAVVFAFSIPAAMTLALTYVRPAYAIAIFALVAAPTFMMLHPAADMNIKMGHKSNPLTFAILINTTGCLFGTLLGASLRFVVNPQRIVS